MDEKTELKVAMWLPEGPAAVLGWCGKKAPKYGKRLSYLSETRNQILWKRSEWNVVRVNAHSSSGGFRALLGLGQVQSSELDYLGLSFGPHWHFFLFSKGILVFPGESLFPNVLPCSWIWLASPFQIQAGTLLKTYWWLLFTLWTHRTAQGW